jgi:two-component system sensor histidine kinase QseC
MSWLDGARRSLRGRLALTVGAGLVLVLGVGFVALHVLIRDQLYGELDTHLERRMRAVAQYAATHPGREDVAEFMPEFRTRAHEDFFQIWDAHGRTLVRSDSSAGRDLPRLDSSPSGPRFRDMILPDGHRGRAVWQAFELPAGDTRGVLTVVTAEEIENLDRLEHRIHLLLLLVSVATVIAAILMSILSIQRGLRPVADMARTLEGVGADEPRAALDSQSLPEELRPVAGSFASLLDRLLAALAREKRYARNVAHELRNPLAEIRLLADVGSNSPTLEAARSSIRDIGTTTAEMEQIVDALMALTRYEAGIEKPEPEPVDLCDELRRQVSGMSDAARQHGLDLRLELPAECWVYADSALLRRLLANLLGNAIAHAPAGGSVSVRIHPDGHLSFANPAPHLQARDVPHLNERFFRIGDGHDGSHAGLGLSLATAIAKVLGLSLVLELSEDRCLEARIGGFQKLPAGSPAA